MFLSSTQTSRALANGIFSAIFLLAAWRYGSVTDSFSAAPLSRTWWFLVMGAGMVGVVLSWPWRQSRTGTIGVLLLAVLGRIAIFSSAPSDDMYRYIWEGQLVAQGVSPYLGTAEDALYAGFRDENWERMNHRDRLTAYPPLSEWLFGGMVLVSRDPYWFKLVFTLCDLVVVGLILLTLRRRSLPVRWACWYACNPVTLVAFAAEGHFDVWLVAALTGTALAAESGRFRLAAVLLAVAVQCKFVALLGLPFLWRREGGKILPWFLASLLLPALPFWRDLDTLIHGVVAFGRDGSFNGALHPWLQQVFSDRTWPNLLCLLLFLGLCGWRIFLHGKHDFASAWRWVGMGLLICSPIFHFWYFTWVLPFLLLQPRLSWILFSLSQALYFQVWHHAAMTGVWGLSHGETLLLWAPLGLFGVYEARHWRFRPPSGGTTPAHTGIGIVIPTWNAADKLPACLQAIRQSTLAPASIVVADGGSLDATVAVARASGCTVVASARGRGQQLAAGVKALDGRYVVLLHVDCRLPAEALARLHLAFWRDPELVGGALGQRFDQPDGSAGLAGDWFLFGIEALNEMRASTGGVSFGDQVQFYDRARLPDSAFPDFPLMEDVELSLRLQDRGNVTYLGCECLSGAEKWHQGNRWPRLRQVLHLVTRYRWCRLWQPHRLRELTAKLYQEYYRK